MNFYELSLLLEDEETTTKVITLDDDFDIEYGEPQLANRVVPGYSNKIKDVIKHTYDEFKKAAWDQKAQDFGYTDSSYIPHPPEGFDELSDEGKKAVVYERALGLLRSFIVPLGWTINPNYTRGNYSWKREKYQFPPEFIKWAEYMIDEMKHDEEIKGWEERSEKERTDGDKARQEEARKQGEVAKAFGKALYKQRKKIEKFNPEWAGLTEKEAIDMAAGYMEAQPYERGQYMPIIQQIANTVMGRSGSAKSYYMGNSEIEKFTQSTTKNVQQMTDTELVDAVNKTIGILNHDDVWGNDFGEMPPALSSGALNSVIGLRMQAVNELKDRLIMLSQVSHHPDKIRVMHQLYYHLDSENRRFFFQQS